MSFCSKINIEILLNRVRRTGIDIIVPRCTGAQEMELNLSGKADRVMVDAPCSGRGALRRNPEIAITITQRDVAMLAELHNVC
ncbi:MAG TPA: hypothetical protein VLH40_04585 [Atribacteraceae bacterium]|nr:hypothetical protein [Atribacteraceae bacterium]